MMISSIFYRFWEEPAEKKHRSRTAARKLAERQLLVRHEVLRDLQERKMF